MRQGMLPTLCIECLSVSEDKSSFHIQLWPQNQQNHSTGLVNDLSHGALQVVVQEDKLQGLENALLNMMKGCW